MDFQQHHTYMRPPPPPPPSMADPVHQLPRQTVPPPGPWYSNQFQFHRPQHPPSPPPPPPQQWAPPPQPDYPPYHGHHLHSNQYPPQPHFPPRPPVPPPQHQIPSPYPQPNQDWGNSNWAQHQGWEYPAQNNEEDWAAKARAWAATKGALDTQHPRPQFTPVGRQEEQNPYHDQYTHGADPHFSENQPSFPAPNYQQYPASASPPNRTPIGHLQEPAFFSSGQSSYAPDGHLSYTARDGKMAADSNAAFFHQESSSSSASVHQQEVPSSYSSVTGKEAVGDQTDNFYRSYPLPVSSTPQHYVQPSLPPINRSASMDQPHYGLSYQSSEPATDLSDQPLNFTPRFNHDHDPHLQHNYTRDSVGAMSSIHGWNPASAPGAAYSAIPSAMPPGSQVDPSLLAPPSLPGHSGPLFGGVPVPSFQPPISSVNGPFGFSSGTAIHPTSAFPADVYGAAGVAERPKKASVPNWLKEEIIKKKAAIANVAPELEKEEKESFEDEDADKFLGKNDQADSKSIDSSRSAEDDDDDEDDAEATRTAAINQEIKRVLTEVLMKVTDELFDEIATKVLSEDNLTVEVDHNVATPSHQVAPSVTTPVSSARVLVPAKAKDVDSDDVGGKSASSPTGDVLGLGSYASSDDEDDEVPNPSKSKSKEIIEHKQPTHSEAGNEVHVKKQTNSNGDSERMNANEATGSHKSNVHDDKLLDDSDAAIIKDGGEEKVIVETELSKSSMEESQSSAMRNKPDKNDADEIKRSSASKDRKKEKGDDSNKKHVRKEHKDDRNGSKDRKYEDGDKSEENAKSSGSKKRSSHLEDKDVRKETERDRRASAKEAGDRKREKTKDDRHNTNDSERHKRHRSSSVGRRGSRHSKENSSVSHAIDSSDESSDDSKRKRSSRRHDLSPSPPKSRRRQVSRSPHSKRSSHRRHSPYSSLDTTRGRRSRSRSRSPVRRQR